LSQIRCARAYVEKHCLFGKSACAGRAMSKQDAGYDYQRYRNLLAEAVDDDRRLELIDLLIKEKARDRLEAQRTSDRVAMTTVTVARILGASGRRDNFKLG
jgi:hypothetical protein